MLIKDIIKLEEVLRNSKTPKVIEIKDKYNLDYSYLAELMGVSRTTFYRRLKDHKWSDDNMKFIEQFKG